MQITYYQISSSTNEIIYNYNNFNIYNTYVYLGLLSDWNGNVKGKYNYFHPRFNLTNEWNEIKGKKLNAKGECNL